MAGVSGGNEGSTVATGDIKTGLCHVIQEEPVMMSTQC